MIFQKFKAILAISLIVFCIAIAAYNNQNIKEEEKQQETKQVQKEISQQETTEQQIEQEMTHEIDFSKVALLGNSQIDGFRIYEPLPEVDCLYRVGLTVRTVDEKSMVGEDIPVLDQLNQKQYEYIFIQFGENELGWTYPEIFIEEYGALIESLKKTQPNAKLYIQSILPVSAVVSEKNENQTNNERIGLYNTMLQELAKEMQIAYLDVAAVMQDENGNLPADAAVDGIHPGRTYYEKWADLIQNEVEKGELA